MSTYETIEPIEVVNAPWNKELTFSNATYEGGFEMLHIRIKEGKRFTDVELDPVTAAQVAELIGAWAKNHTSDE